METEKILLASAKSKTSSDKEVLMGVELTNEFKKFPVDSIDTKIDQYLQYVKENDASHKYRFVFTVAPICSNVLFNHNTEIVSNEGSDVCKLYKDTYREITEATEKGAALYYDFKNGKITPAENRTLTSRTLIQDTGYSHPKCGGFVYHCGYDIFNNHILRQKEFTVVNFKPVNVTNMTFNTISDVSRDYDGTVIKDNVQTGTTQSECHLYSVSTIRTFEESIRDNLIERDGWFGFKNPTMIEVNNVKLRSTFDSNSGSGGSTPTEPIGGGEVHALRSPMRGGTQEPVVQYQEVCVNKCMNNNKACEFIDMYPDRSLYSFMPKINKARNREEYNWEYCLTYPYKSITGCTLTSYVVNDEEVANGMLAEFVSDFSSYIGEMADILQYAVTDSEYRDIIVRTKCKNTIQSGSVVRLSIIATNDSGTNTRCFETQDVTVKNIGLGGYADQYYFSIGLSDVISVLDNMNTLRFTKDVYCYVRKVVNGRPCKYYFRMFKRLPNFKGVNIIPADGLTEEDINNNMFRDFSSTLNRLAFSNTIYNDKIAQVVYNDDIDTSGLRDNLGRELSEVFFTIVKTNKGHDIWYSKDTLDDSSIEFSHCFGEVRSGLDLPWFGDDYNVHKIHGLPSITHDQTVRLFPKSVLPLEYDITINGHDRDIFSPIKSTATLGPQEEQKQTKTGLFWGDLVEFSENDILETVLENVQHRFNTAQRETLNKNFEKLYHDEIIIDDFMIVKNDNDRSHFRADSQILAPGYRTNIAPEGYYYQPHYRVELREFDSTVNEGYHTRVQFDTFKCIKQGNTAIYKTTAKTDKNYYLNVNDTIYIYPIDGSGRIDGIITSVGGDDFRDIQFQSSKLTNDRFQYVFFKPNSEKPATAYDFNDLSGKYIWRDFVSVNNISIDSKLYNMVFTNGAHYVEQRVNLYLRRQDPYGVYGLNYASNQGIPEAMQKLEISGLEKDTSEAQYFDVNINPIC